MIPIATAKRVTVEIEIMAPDGRSVIYTFELAPADRSDFILKTETGQLRLGLDLIMDTEAVQVGDFMATRETGGAMLKLAAHGMITKQERRQSNAQRVDGPIERPEVQAAQEE